MRTNEIDTRDKIPDPVELIKRLKQALHTAGPGRVEIWASEAVSLVEYIEKSITPDGYYLECLEGIYPTMDDLVLAIHGSDDYDIEPGGWLMASLHRQRALGVVTVQVIRDAGGAIIVKELTEEEDDELYARWRTQQEEGQEITVDGKPEPNTIEE